MTAMSELVVRRPPPVCNRGVDRGLREVGLPVLVRACAIAMALILVGTRATLAHCDIRHVTSVLASLEVG
jgi:hypothetical protein